MPNISNLCRLLCVLIVLTCACDKPSDQAKPSSGTSGSATSESNKTKVGDATTGSFSVKLKISGTAEAYQTEGAPKPDEVEKKILDALYASEAFEAGGPRELEGMVTYDLKPLPDDAGSEVVLFGSLNSPDANFSAGVQHQSSDDRWKGKPIGEMIDGAIQRWAEQVSAQARVVGGDEAKLLEILGNDDEPEAARLMAIHQIRERRLEQHVETLRPFLAKEQPEQLRMAAAAALVSLGDKKSRTEILAIAEDLSRDRNPKYVPMLHILGDLGGDEVTTYLQAVSEGHSAPAVRSVAKEALLKADRQEKSP